MHSNSPLLTALFLLIYGWTLLNLGSHFLNIVYRAQRPSLKGIYRWIKRKIFRLKYNRMPSEEKVIFTRKQLIPLMIESLKRTQFQFSQRPHLRDEIKLLDENFIVFLFEQFDPETIFPNSQENPYLLMDSVVKELGNLELHRDRDGFLFTEFLKMYWYNDLEEYWIRYIHSEAFPHHLEEYKFTSWVTKKKVT